ncbi:MAG: hypothetical protein IT210_13885 [Armatimonadetes bacterium]|nr:hypothetical protein [Armatimonadota bacterium]
MGFVMTEPAPAGKARGPLRVHPINPRYFTDGSGKAVYLTGSHIWVNLQDIGKTDPPPILDCKGYLNFLQTYHHNFMRLWRWEMPRDIERDGITRYCQPHPWKRTGPGTAWDGKPKFDLSVWDKDYFKRLRSRIIAARDRDIYVAVMLFEGWALRFATWEGHPFAAANNINGIDGDANDDGKGIEIQMLRIPEVTALQEAYVRKVVDTVNDLDNVLYEISNESDPACAPWQYHMIRYIKRYEAAKPEQHPVGMTSCGGGGPDDTQILFDSPADWISPSAARDDYAFDPPAAAGAKVILNDSDHQQVVWSTRAWVWKSFCRGLNPIWMDPYDSRSAWEPVPDHAENIRKNMGYTLNYANRMRLADAKPLNGLASSGYCLANPGKEYLVYLSDGGEVAVDLSAVSGAMAVEWLNPSNGAVSSGGAADGGARRIFKPPFDGDAVLYISHK